MVRVDGAVEVLLRAEADVLGVGAQLGRRDEELGHERLELGQALLGVAVVDAGLGGRGAARRRARRRRRRRHRSSTWCSSGASVVVPPASPLPSSPQPPAAPGASTARGARARERGAGGTRVDSRREPAPPVASRGGPSQLPRSAGMRRLRRTPALRRLVAETRLTVDDLVAPLFVREGIAEAQPIASLPGVVQHTRESLRKEVAELAGLGVPAVILFGVPATKDAEGSGAWDPEGIVQLALADLRAEVGDDVVLMADLCVDEYTDHGHCGALAADGTVDNDATIAGYARAAVAQADAGAHVVAPSGMMDGQVAAIRAGLDAAGHLEVADPRLRRQVRVEPLRPVPRRGRRADRGGRRSGGRPQGLPAGPRQRPRGARRGAPRPRRGRRHGDGQAGPRLPRRPRRACGARSTCPSPPTTCRASTRW